MAMTGLEKARKGRAKRRQYVQQKKLKSGCTSCGANTGDPTQLHFHHRDPETKFKKVSDMLTYSFKRIDEEIAKCDILCEGCHEAIHTTH